MASHALAVSYTISFCTLYKYMLHQFGLDVNKKWTWTYELHTVFELFSVARILWWWEQKDVSFMMKGWPSWGTLWILPLWSDQCQLFVSFFPWYGTENESAIKNLVDFYQAWCQVIWNLYILQLNFHFGCIFQSKEENNFHYTLVKNNEAR